MNISELYPQVIGDVYRYNMFKLQNREEAEDATQEVMLRLFSKQDLTISDLGQLRAYAIGIARNVIYEIYRQRTKANTEAESAEEITTDADIELEHTVIDSVLAEQVQRELETLDELSREIIVLRVWEDLRFHEIADILEVSENTVKTKFYRGVDAVKQKLAAGGDVRARSVTAPLILAGVLALTKSAELSIPGGLVQNIFSLLQTQGLIVNSSIMTGTITAATGAASTAAGTGAATSSAGILSSGLLATTAGKVIAGVIAVTAVTSGVVGGAVVLNNRQQQTGSTSSASQTSMSSTATTTTSAGWETNPAYIAAMSVNTNLKWSEGPTAASFNWYGDPKAASENIAGYVMRTSEFNFQEELLNALKSKGWSTDETTALDSVQASYTYWSYAGWKATVVLEYKDNGADLVFYFAARSETVSNSSATSSVEWLVNPAYVTAINAFSWPTNALDQETTFDWMRTTTSQPERVIGFVMKTNTVATSDPIYKDQLLPKALLAAGWTTNEELTVDSVQASFSYWYYMGWRAVVSYEYKNNGIVVAFYFAKTVEAI